ncbi:MAG: hypothetical protein K2Y13_10365 [Burkholderiaceae bacterium]|nr:hypothetical protein [Burkholderiaceae bacterium]
MDPRLYKVSGCFRMFTPEFLNKHYQGMAGKSGWKKRGKAEPFRRYAMANEGKIMR